MTEDQAREMLCCGPPSARQHSPQLKCAGSRCMGWTGQGCSYNQVRARVHDLVPPAARYSWDERIEQWVQVMGGSE